MESWSEASSTPRRTRECTTILASVDEISHPNRPFCLKTKKGWKFKRETRLVNNDKGWKRKTERPDTRRVTKRGGGVYLRNTRTQANAGRAGLLALAVGRLVGILGKDSVSLAVVAAVAAGFVVVVVCILG